MSHVASNDTLTKVAEDVRALSAKVDGLANSGASLPALTAIENRIDGLSAALNASTEAGHAVPVSYTHLDVYKRQPLTPSGAPSIRASTRWMMFSARSCSPAEMKIFVPVIL